MANIENKDLEQLLSNDNSESQDAENRIKDKLVDELNNPAVRNNILNILRTTSTASAISSIDFSEQLPSIINAINNLTVDTTDQAEIDRLNNDRKKLRQKVNTITRRALIERISDLENEINSRPGTDPDIIMRNLRRKIFTTYLQEAYERNGGRPLNTTQIRDILVGFYNNNYVFPDILINQDRAIAFAEVVGFASVPNYTDLSPAEIERTIDSILAIDLTPARGVLISNIIRESEKQYNAWGGRDSIEQREINQARLFVDQLRDNLTSELISFDHSELVDLLITDGPITASFVSPERSALINQIRTKLGPIGTGTTAGQERTRRLARLFNLRVAYDANHVYQQDNTRQNVIDHLRTWQEALSVDIQNGLRNRINELIDNNTEDFTANPDALNRIISSYISEITENGLYGDNENERMTNAYRFFYSELTAGTIATPATLPIEEADLRNVIEQFLNQAPSIIDSHNAHINRINTVVRDRTYEAIRNQALGLHVPFTNDDVDNASERALQRLLTTDAFTLDEIAQVLYLPLNRRDRTDIVRDIASKIRALRTEIRFAENPRKRLSDTEINTMLIPFMPNCEKIVEELMRVDPTYGALNKYEYRLQLETVLNNPNTNHVLYLKFKEIAGKYGNITDISMLQDISMHRALQNHGYTLNLTQVMNAGFRPNPLLRSFIQNNIVSFNDCLSGYNNIYDYIRERYDVLRNIPEGNRSPEQNSDIELLTEINTNIQSFNDLIKDISENYRNISARPAEDRARRLYNILEKKYNTANGTATPLFVGSFPGASDMEENLAKSYKALTALNTVFVPRVEENTLVPEIDPSTGRPKMGPNGQPIMINPAEAERRPMENARKKYAKNRRNLQKWMWFSRPKQDELNDSKDDYLVAMRDYSYNQIQNEFPESDFNGSPEKIRQRQVDRRNRILELLNSERRDLFDEELRAQTTQEGFIRRGFNKFRNGWRNKKGLRLIGASTCMGVALTGAMLGAPALAIGTFATAGAVLRGVSTYMGWTAGWEGIRNRFGKTKRLDRTKISAMTPDQIREAMAAQTTLALSEKGQPFDIRTGVSPANMPMDVLVRPVSDKSFDQAENPNLNAMFGEAYKETTAKPSDTNYYRQASSRELFANQNQRMRNLIDNRFATGTSMMEVLNEVYSEEAKLMDAIEKREVAIRKSNTKKHLTGVALGTFMGVGLPGIFALKDWLFSEAPPVPVEGGGISPDPVPAPSPEPLPVPFPSDEAKLIIPDKVSSPYVGNADLLVDPTLQIDETPGIWQSIANKLDMTHGTRVIDSNPAIKQALLNENPILNGNLDLVRTGQEINISRNTAQMIADSLNTSRLYSDTYTADHVLTRLHSPWPDANMK